MRKLLSLLLSLLIMTSMTYTVFGLDYRETAMNYLTEKYDAPNERIGLYEGGITELKYTAESFWFASFTIAPEGKSLPDMSAGNMVSPASQPVTLPAPDMPTDSGNEIAPVPPKDMAGDGYIYGGIYIRIKTGEVLEQDKMEPFFTAENQLANQEWERLRKEAGKLDVSLYQKLQGLSSMEKVTVSIQPAPAETDELKAQFEALKKKYPEQTSGMELTNILPYYYGYDISASSGGGSSSASGSSGFAVPTGDAAVTYAAPGSNASVTDAAPGSNASVTDAVTDDKSIPTPPDAVTDAKTLPAGFDEKYMQEYNAMWEQMEQIRLQAVASSLSTIKGTLDGMGVTYKDNGTYIAADLTKGQINDIANLPAVSAIFEDGIFYALDSGKAILAPNSASNEMMAASGVAVRDAGSPSYLPVILIIAAFAALSTAAFMIYRKRFSHTR